MMEKKIREDNDKLAGENTPRNSVMHSDYTRQDEQGDADLPGYPHYPSNEDLLNPSNSEERVDLDVDDLSRTPKMAAPKSDDEATAESEEDIDIVAGTEADVTAEDLMLLGPKDQDMDMGEDEEIRRRSGFAMDHTGEDLDVPGSEMDDANEDIGEEDEENNYYSLGDENA